MKLKQITARRAMHSIGHVYFWSPSRKAYLHVIELRRRGPNLRLALEDGRSFEVDPHTPFFRGR